MPNVASNPFHPPDSGSTPLPGAAVWFGGNVHYFNVGSNGETVYDAICNSPFVDIGSPVSWSNGKINEDQVGAKVETKFPPAPTVAGTSLYLFWLDEDWEYAAVTRMGSGGNWCSYAVLQDTSGASIGTKSAPVTAAAIDASRILVMMADTSAVYFYVFFVDDFQPGQPWKARSQRQVAEAQLSSVMQGNPRVGLRPTSCGLALTIFSRDGGNEDNGMPATYVVLGVPCTGGGGSFGATVVCMLQVDADMLPVATSLSKGWFVNSYAGSVSLAVDPGGRVRMDYVDIAPKTQLLSTAGRDPTWSAEADSLPDQMRSRMRPVCCFPTQPRAEGEFQSYKWMFFQGPSGSYTDDIACLASPYGLLRRRKDVDVVDLTEVTREQRGIGLRALLGFVDGPPPVPQANVATNPSKLLGTVTYGSTSSSTETFTTEQDWVFGVKVEGELELATWGPAWEASFKRAMGSTFTESTVQSTLTTMKLVTTADANAVAPLAAVFVGDISLHADAFEFIPEGASEPATDGPQYHAIYTELGGPIVLPTRVFTATPGDLASYMVDAWNARMKAAGISDEYIAEVIEPNALVVGQGTTRRNYLLFSWASSGSTDTQVVVATSTFSESRWKYEADAYTGVKFEILDSEQKVLVGAEWEQETVERDLSLEQLGISLLLSVPPAIDVPGAVQAYTFKLFFMPADARWTKELFSLCTDTTLLSELDQGSAAWKIMYVVTEYRPNALVDDLAHDGLPAEHIRALQAEGLTTTAMVMAKLGTPTFPAIEARLADPSLDDRTRPLLQAMRSWAVRTTVRQGDALPTV